MKPSKALEKEIYHVYDIWLHSYINGDVKTYDSYLDDDYRFIGSTNNEEFLSKKETTQFFENTADQLAGKTEIRNSKRTLELIDGLAFLTDLFDAYFLNEAEWTYYGRFRFSCVLRKNDSGWRFVYQHFSTPDLLAQDGETIGYDQVNAENLQLKEAIKRRTIELDQKNRALEIEVALEKVRSRTMAMQHCDELGEVSFLLDTQVRGLGLMTRGCAFNIYGENESTEWFSSEFGTIPEYKTPRENVFLRYYNMGQKGETFYVKEFEGLACKNHYDYLCTLPVMGDALKEMIANGGSFPTRQIDHVAFFKYGYLLFITLEPLPESHDIFKRFAQVFEQTYIRFLDLQKAEVQAREKEIELGLEKVRSRSMAMHKSEEIGEVALVLFDQLQSLGGELWGTGFGFCKENSDTDEFWFVNAKGIMPYLKIPNTVDPSHKKMYKGWQENLELLSFVKDGKELEEHYEYMLTVPDVKSIFEGMLNDGISFPTWQKWHAAYFSHGYLLAITTTPYEDESIFKRFTKVFEQVYIRFLDLQKAEAQAREAQIEAALEKVRSRSLAMHKSNELNEVVSILFEKIKELHIPATAVGIAINIEGSKDLNAYVCGENENGLVITNYRLPYFKNQISHDLCTALEKKLQYFVGHYSKEQKDSFYKYLLEHTTEFKDLPADILRMIFESPSYAITMVAVKNAVFNINDFEGKVLAEKDVDIIKRFAKVFDQAYTRFLDLQKAEAQAREAEIEAALERVRSRSIGMQKSEELKEVIKIINQQLNHLKINLDHAGFVVDYTPGGDWHFWIADAQDIPSKITHPYFESVWATQFNEAKEKGAELFATNLNFEEKNKFYTELLSYVPELPQASKDFYLSCPGLAATTVLFDNVSLYIENFAGTPYTDEENKILMRFGKVFQQTYTRFLDLQNAETQNREAQIELSLERLRAKTMAMHNSNDVGETAAVMVDELKKLGVETIRCGIGIMDQPGDMELWTIITENDKSAMIIGWLDMSIHPLLHGAVESWRNKQESYYYELKGDDLSNYFNAINHYPGYPIVYKTNELDKVIHHYQFYFAEGTLFAFSLAQLSAEQRKIFSRFAKVFGQTYRRYLDLQKAEAQAREAEIELALERVRARTMAMQHSEELSDTAAILFQQFNGLGQEIMQMTIGIIQEDKGITEFSVTDWSGSGAGVNRSFDFSNDEPSVISKLFAGWKQQKKSIVVDLEGKELQEWLTYRNAMSNVTIQSEDSGGRRVITSAFFSKGHLSFSSPLPPTIEIIQLLERFTKVFEQTYTRFIDLQKAEAQAREAKIETALEKVRSRTMAMQKSTELGETATLLFEQMNALVPDLWSCGFVLCDKNKSVDEWWLSGGNGYMPDLILPNTGDLTHSNIYKAWLQGSSYHEEVVEGDELQKHYEWLMTIPVAKAAFDAQAAAGIQRPVWQQLSCAYFTQGYLVVITEVPCREIDLFKRFAKVFEQTYTRFIDLQKAEAQAREAQIEVALERVRSKSLAMHQSNELELVAASLFEAVVSLGIALDGALLFVLNWETKSIGLWIATVQLTKPIFIDLPFEEEIKDNEVIREFWRIAGQQSQALNLAYSGPTKNDYFRYVHRYNGWKIPDLIKQLQIDLPVWNFSFAAEKNTMLGLDSWSGHMFKESDLNIVRRFTRVFEQAYTRFLDLKKSEAQAREAEIELALERVRARTMAMQNSDELPEAANLLFQQMQALGMPAWSAGYCIWEDDKKAITLWMSSEGVLQLPFRAPLTEDPSFIHMREAYERGESFFVEEIGGDELVTHYKYMRTLPVVGEVLDSIIQAGHPLPTFQIFHCVYFLQGFLLFITYEQAPHAHEIFKRFGKVFDQTYTRFLDLQKAEAQAKEAMIENALEKVRSRTMGMQKSDELSDAASEVFKQIQLLGIHPWSFGFNIFDSDYEVITQWVSSADGRPIAPFDSPAKEDVFGDFTKAAQNGETLYVNEIGGEKLVKHYEYMSTLPVVGDAIQELKSAGIEMPTFQIFNLAFFKQGYLMFITYEHVPEAHDIFKRFAKVFEQTYTRFLDLKKAEAQAKEAKIEAALERVRAKAMAMQSSQDLSDTIGTFYKQLKSFNLVPRRCGVGLLYKDTKECEVFTWNTTQLGESLELVGKIKMEGHPVLENVYGNWVSQTDYHPVLKGNEIKEYYEVIRPQMAFPDYQQDEVHYGYFFMFEEGGVYAWKETPLKEDELTIYKRFTSVLSLTYKRYKDLKDAEAREKEAIKQAALDRVRADIASMRSTADLDRITPLIWKELTTLGIPFIRCGVFIMDEIENRVHTYLSTPDGSAIAAFHTPMDDSGNLLGAIDSWRQQKVFVTHWGESDFQLQADILLKQGSITSRMQYLNTLPAAGFNLHFLPFKQGMLYVGNQESLSSDVLQTVQSLADAFAIAYARYEDFIQLEQAKARIEATLSDLKAAQNQLIQSEKMASLGELTAGIAHEIQNPLNFVNNFSEVSGELLSELKDELDKGDIEEAKTISDDVIQNLQKINHHGQRASSIVKGMLEHSRTSSGKKELTDINSLCDEYLRLAYHGLRARDRSFNADFKSDFDPSIPKLAVVPQDIGRVLLNLINNAFQAVGSEGIKNPTVTLKTERVASPLGVGGSAESIQINVSDNGPGIPDNIKDKIFQPFFTTKPTGQGTGLGLSLAYDIVKAHGGEIKVESVEGEGTKFIIQLRTT